MAQRTANGLQILLVDDNAEVRAAIRMLLGLLGHQVIEAGEGREAFELLKTWPTLIDVILLDLHMPGMGGREFLAVSAQHRRLFRLPVVLISADDSADLEVDHVISKPIDTGKLMQVLDRYRKKK